MTRRRLDAELVRRGLAPTVEEARGAIAAGRVVVGGRAIAKNETLVAPSEPVTLAGDRRPFASRAGEKLSAALDRFGVVVSGRSCLDAGSSTGGFTDVLLSRGAARVVAVDVGYGQLAWRLRNDARVTVMDRTNARDLRAGQLPFVPALVTADLSFISLTKVVPALVEVSDPAAELVLLVKPQFEAPREDVGRRGVVTDRSVWRRAMDTVIEACAVAGAPAVAAMASPLPGPAGNVEFFLRARRGAEPSDVDLDPALAEGASVLAAGGEAS